MLQKNPVLMYGIALIVIGIFALLIIRKSYEPPKSWWESLTDWKMKKKRNWIIISIISLVVIGFVVYYFTIYKSSKEGDLIFWKIKSKY